jgi:hypothetical protein
MQTARDIAYMPDVYISDAVFLVAWNSEGTLVYDYPENLPKYFMQYEISFNPVFEMQNIGLGTAKQIEFNWNYKSNIQKLSDYHYEINPQTDFKCSIDNFSIGLFVDGSPSQSNNWNDKILFPFFQNDAQQINLFLPKEFQMIIEDIYRESLSDDNFTGTIPEIPDLETSISYSDVQGKKYYKEIIVTFSTTFATPSPDNDGFAIVGMSMRPV